MQIFPDLRKYKAKSSRSVVLAMGNFDGFHLGHQALLSYVVRQAKKRGALSAVLTFREHPHSVLHPARKPMMLMSPEQKLFYFSRAGIDLCFLQSFTPAFAKMTARDFAEKILVRKLHILEICMGYDAHFGRGREGDTSLMEKLARENGFLFRKMAPVRAGGVPVSSSRVRELLMKGEVEKAGKCLGRPFSMFGKVVRGKGHGTHLGFPTANLEVHSEVLLPLGVYVASARFLSVERCAGRWLPGVMNFGKRPTYPKNETPKPVLELHLFDFKGCVYEETMEVALHHFLRREQKFSSEEMLREKIAKDVVEAKKYYAKLFRSSGRLFPDK